MDRQSNIDAVRVIQVIEVESIFGTGKDGDPIRKILEYYSMEGELLARVDNWRNLGPTA